MCALDEAQNLSRFAYTEQPLTESVVPAADSVSVCKRYKVQMTHLEHATQAGPTAARQGSGLNPVETGCNMARQGLQIVLGCVHKNQHLELSRHSPKCPTAVEPVTKHRS